jgi:multidrug resistance efflux pump
MRENAVLDLAECTEFRQTLQARPPRIVHGTVLLLGTLLGTALAWAALTKADLVVRAPGRVRPVAAPKKVFNAGRADVLSAGSGARVIEVNCREGDTVCQGDVLIRLSTERLDNDITKQKRTVRSGEEELAELVRLQELTATQYEATRAKAEAELAQALEEVRKEKAQQATDVRLAALDLASAQDDEERLARLADKRAAAQSDLVKAVSHVREAKEKWQKAQLPVDQSRVEVLRRALTLTDKDFAVKREELAMKRGVKEGDLEAARTTLANLELEREQAVLRAPMDGVVTAGDVRVGDLLEAGKAVVEIAEQQGFRFELTVPSEDVADLRVGMPAQIKLDALDYQKYGTLRGTVSFIAPDSSVPEGQQAASYVVRIDVEGDEVGQGGVHGRVKLGMSGQGEVVTGQESLLLLLVKKVRRTISLG